MEKFNTGKPLSKELKPDLINAQNYSFGIGCLVVSFDKGNYFFQ
jgi:hypothetical protein